MEGRVVVVASCGAATENLTSTLLRLLAVKHIDLFGVSHPDAGRLGGAPDANEAGTSRRDASRASRRGGRTSPRDESDRQATRRAAAAPAMPERLESFATGGSGALLLDHPNGLLRLCVVQRECSSRHPATRHRRLPTGLRNSEPTLETSSLTYASPSAGIGSMNAPRSSFFDKQRSPS